MKKSKHITIDDLQNCCGCRACASICPRQCIVMSPADDGCLYPRVDTAKCIECGACVDVCPFINVDNSVEPKQCYAAFNGNDEERILSSSGGVFVSLARDVISCGGVVFGAVFDHEYNVRHVKAECIEDITPMMGSKYVQSDTATTFAQTRQYLKAGREVLYTGTPCQIAGLKHFLKHNYSNLLAVEVICHGAPAPGVWRSYLDEKLSLLSGNKPICKKAHPLGISFRDKREGWKNYGFSIVADTQNNGEESPAFISYYQPSAQNEYMRAFLWNWSLRPSCYACRAKSGHSHADITMGDFWGIENHTRLTDDNRGTSCLIARTSKGVKALSQSSLNIIRMDYADILGGNPCIEQSVRMQDNARRFKRLFIRYGFYKTFRKVNNPSFVYRCTRYAKRKLGL